MHIDYAPKKPVQEKQLLQLVEINTADGSHAPVQKVIYNFSRLNLGSMYDCFTIPSHGMDACTFIKWGNYIPVRPKLKSV